MHETVRFLQDLSLIVGFFIRNQLLFAPTFGGWGAFGLYMFARYAAHTQTTQFRL